jgi:hypothetical protein
MSPNGSLPVALPRRARQLAPHACKCMSPFLFSFPEPLQSDRLVWQVTGCKYVLVCYPSSYKDRPCSYRLSISRDTPRHTHSLMPLHNDIPSSPLPCPAPHCLPHMRCRSLPVSAIVERDFLCHSPTTPSALSCPAPLITVTGRPPPPGLSIAESACTMLPFVCSQGAPRRLAVPL